jgi:hypothetical protein
MNMQLASHSALRRIILSVSLTAAAFLAAPAVLAAEAPTGAVAHSVPTTKILAIGSFGGEAEAGGARARY